MIETIQSDGSDFPDPGPQKKKPYEAPRIVSDEPLEVAAALCDPPTGGFGKSDPLRCGRHGS